MDYVALGRRIRQRRKSLGLTQEMLSIKSGVSLPFIGLIERGERKASMDTFVMLANALSLSTDVLLQDSLNEGLLSINEDYVNQNKLIKEMRRLLSLTEEDVI